MNANICYKFVLIATLFISIKPVLAADWSSTNIQLLVGNNYQDGGGSFGNSLDDKEKLVVSLEHVSGWAYGDNFFFIDISNPNDAGTAYYAEYSPKLSYNKITNSKINLAFINDFHLAMGTEWGDNVRAYLFGAGVSLAIPGFTVADVSLYTRKSYSANQSTDLGYQVTAVWLAPVQFGNWKFVFEGFADYAFGENSGSMQKSNNLVAGPRFLIDIGQLFGSADKVHAGVEYQIWRNKYGIKDVDEDVAQLMIKWIF